MPIYHASRTPLELGTVVQSRFGTSEQDQRIYAIVRSALAEGEWAVKSLLLAEALVAASHGRDAGLRMYVKEAILEAVRTSNFPERPRRLGSVFLCPTLEDAAKFQKAVGDRPHLYICSIEGGTQAELDLMFASGADPLAPIRQQLQYLWERTRRYWNGDKSENPIMEVVTDGTVTVLESVSV